MKTEIGRLKIKQILKSYIKENKTSNVILEQNNDIPLPNKLKSMVGCFSASLKPSVTKMGGVGNYEFSIRTTGTKGGVRYFYIDGKVAEKLTPDAALTFRKSPEFDWEPSKCAPSQQSSSYTEAQKSFIESWKSKHPGAKFQDELRDEELNKYTKQLVSPKSDRIFTEDLFMWLPPANLKTGDAITQFKQQAAAQQPTDNKGCKDAVKTFYTEYKNQSVIDPSVVLALNKQVKACRTRYYKKWGTLQGLLGGGNKLDDMLEELSQITPITSPWYVTAR
jgi:hypothetical protein